MNAINNDNSNDDIKKKDAQVNDVHHSCIGDE